MRELVKTLLGMRRIQTQKIVDQVGVHRSSVHRYFAGETDIASSTLAAMLKMAGVDLEKIIMTEIQSQLGREDTEFIHLGREVELIFKKLSPIDQRTLIESVIGKAHHIHDLDVSAQTSLRRLEVVRNSLYKERGG